MSNILYIYIDKYIRSMSKWYKIYKTMTFLKSLTVCMVVALRNGGSRMAPLRLGRLVRLSCRWTHRWAPQMSKNLQPPVSIDIIDHRVIKQSTKYLYIYIYWMQIYTVQIVDDSVWPHVIHQIDSKNHPKSLMAEVDWGRMGPLMDKLCLWQPPRFCSAGCSILIIPPILST